MRSVLVNKIYYITTNVNQVDFLCKTNDECLAVFSNGYITSVRNLPLLILAYGNGDSFEVPQLLYYIYYTVPYYIIFLFYNLSRQHLVLLNAQYNYNNAFLLNIFICYAPLVNWCHYKLNAISYFHVALKQTPQKDTKPNLFS